MIKAKVKIETAKRTYKPGEIIGETLSAADLAFFKKHKFIEVIEETAADEEDQDDDGREKEMKNSDPGGGTNEDGEFQEEQDGIVYKDESSIKKMNKDEIVMYAASIGLQIDPELLKNDMVDKLLNHIDEMMEGQ
jgi:chromatin remodeling complex protein RSC6